MGRMVILFMALIFVSGLMITTAGAVSVIIGFKDKADPEIVQPHGKVTHNYKYIPAVAADLPEQAIENLKKNNKIAYIEPDYEVSVLEETVPWGITRIGAPSVHTNGNKGTGINVAIIDTGINYNHPDLCDNYKGGYDFVNDDADPLDDNGHGTHCAGIIAAADNDIGVIGVAPEANLYSLKIVNNTGRGNTSDLIAAIEWATETCKDTDTSNDIHIISMSLGSNSRVTALDTACSQAYDSGILLVAGAGNDGNRRGTGDSVDYPGAYSSVIAVAATDSMDNRASFSSTGPAVELAAPGVNILSTYLDGWALLSGTSMACPHVAGTAALVQAANPSFTNDNIRDRLAQTATDLGTSGRNNLYGYGLVNAEAAAADSTCETAMKNRKVPKC
jgi:subtilisin/minor extracellular protease Epr